MAEDTTDSALQSVLPGKNYPYSSITSCISLFHHMYILVFVYLNRNGVYTLTGSIEHIIK
jgi:hypothetical protein